MGVFEKVDFSSVHKQSALHLLQGQRWLFSFEVPAPGINVCIFPLPCSAGVKQNMFCKLIVAVRPSGAQSPEVFMVQTWINKSSISFVI